MAKRTTAAVWVKGIAEMLAAEGLDVAGLFGAVGIDPAALQGPSARVATEKISRLWELAVERSRNPALALAQHQVVRPASFDVVGYTMMSCADLRGAFDRLIRYLLILSDCLTMTTSETDDGYRIDFFLFGGDSLSALDLLHRIEEELKYPLPLNALIEAPTVRQLEERLETAPPGPVDNMIRIHAAGSQHPLFVVGGIHGYCLYLYPVLRSLGPRSAVLRPATAGNGLDQRWM